MLHNIYFHLVRLTSRHGITEIQQISWVNSIHTCGVINKLTQEFAGIHCKTSEQHTLLGRTRCKRDQEVSKIIVNYMKSGSPFEGDPKILRNIATGVAAASHCNADDAKSVGMFILQTLNGNSVENYTFKKKNQAVLMTSKCKGEKNGQTRKVDPVLLFQRF